MAMARDVTIGVRTFRILVNAQVDTLRPVSYVAFAFEGNLQVVSEGGDPIELPASTENQAMARMESYLSRRFR